MGAIFVILLMVLLSLFFGLESFVVNYLGAADIQYLGVSLTSDGFRVALALGIVFCELAVIAFYMLDRVSDALRDIIKPMMRLIPLSLFITTSYNTLSPVIFSLLPPSIGQAFGFNQALAVTQTVQSPDFSSGILATVISMVLFLITTSALTDHRDSARVKQLELQVKRLKKELQSGL